jgi:hypothetical protein
MLSLIRPAQVFAAAVTKALLAIALLSAFGSMLPLAAEPIGPTVMYFNEKFGFSLSLPVDVFEPASARNQVEGGLWVSGDGEARLLAVAGANEAGSSLPAYRQFVMQESYANATIDYAPMRENWFVLSGKKDGRMFYERITFACDGRYIYGWQLTYPAAERARYDAIVEAVHKSYRPGRGEDGRCGRTLPRGGGDSDRR